MTKALALRNVGNPSEIVLLDTAHGTFSHQANSTLDVQGNYMLKGVNEFAVFADHGDLYFQWNDRRWALHGIGARISYSHDFHRKVTKFSVDDESIEYQSWWAGDNTFNINIPERDEDEDYLAYVANLAQNEAMQQNLLRSWRT